MFPAVFSCPQHFTLQAGAAGAALMKAKKLEKVTILKITQYRGWNLAQLLIHDSLGEI